MSKNLHETFKPYVLDGRIGAQTHPRLPLTIFNYTKDCQYNRLWDANTMRTRGLVVDDRGRAVNNPMPKFFNLDEPEAALVDEMKDQPYSVTEKLDGVCVMAFLWRPEKSFWDKVLRQEAEPKVIVHTRGSFRSDQALDAETWLTNRGTEWMREGWTYIFEWIAPESRIVLNYGERRELVLLCAQHLNGTIRQPEYVNEWDGALATAFGFVGLSDIHKMRDYISDKEEGFVITFRDGRRIKIKGEQYLALHRAVTGLSTYRVWEMLTTQGYDGVQTLRETLDEEAADWLDDTVDLFYDQHFTAKLNTYDYLMSVPDTLFVDPKVFADHVNEHVPKHYRPLVFALYREQHDKVDDLAWKFIKPADKREKFSSGLSG